MSKMTAAKARRPAMTRVSPGRGENVRLPFCSGITADLPHVPWHAQYTWSRLMRNRIQAATRLITDTINDSSFLLNAGFTMTFVVTQC